MNYNFNDANYNRLIEAIKSDKLILFIGAGMSMNVGCPSWIKLTELIINEVAKKDQTFETLLPPLINGVMTPLDILNKLEDKYRKDVYEVIDSTINNIGTNYNLEIHEKAISLSSKIITTNYDKIIETVDSSIPVINFTSQYFLSSLHKRNKFLFKLHGSIDNIENCVVFESQYKRYYEKEIASSLELKKIFSEKTILFIGFSVKDPYVKNLFDSVKILYDNNIDTHYIITNTPEDYKSIEYLKAIAIEDHSKLKECIEELLQYKPTETLLEQKKDESLQYESKVEKKISICIMIANPIDKEQAIKEDIIKGYFNNFDIILDFHYFNEDNLSKMWEYNYVIIFTQSVKNKILIEDQYLISKLIDVNDINEYYTNSINGIFIYYYGEEYVSDRDIELPCVMINYETNKIKDVLQSLIYKVFIKTDENALFSGGTIYNKNNILYTKLPKGALCKIAIEHKITEKIDKKNISKFIGRKTDLASIVRRILEIKYEDRILNVKGAGGIGKTLTISKAVYEIAQRGYFPKGVYFIACDSINTFENFQYEISICFDLISSKELIKQIKDNHVTKDRLLILDNFETILYSEDKKQIIELISHVCEYATTIVTSRQILNLEYEYIYELRNFTTDEGVELFKSIYKYVKPQEEKTLRREIVDKLLNNNPLAIKLIALGLVPHKSIETLREELEKNIFNNEDIELIFEKEEDINIERSNSLYHSINYSYQKLSEKEQRAFELLSLFPDGIHLENFKRFSKTKESISYFTDSDIKELFNKSLLENNNGLLKLQSIISRFASFQFQKRSDSYKKEYYKNAFKYNSFISKIVDELSYFNETVSLKLGDNNINNYLKTLSLFNEIEYSDKIKISFLEEIYQIFLNTNQTKEFLKLINIIKNNYEPNDQLFAYLELLKYFTIYWTKEFDDSSNWIINNYPIEIILKEKAVDEEILVSERSLHVILSSFYFCEGYSYEMLKYRLDLMDGRHKIVQQLFQLGFLHDARKYIQIDDLYSFFNVEVLLALNEISIDELNAYAKNIYTKDSLELVQFTYLKQKISSVKNDEIKKLSITNPYTQGLVYLMQAKNSSDDTEKKKLYLNAIKKLNHIKYYFVEAILQYVVYLYNQNDDDCIEWYDRGVTLAKKYHFNYLLFEFLKLENNHIVYATDYSLISKESIDRYHLIWTDYQKKLKQSKHKSFSLLNK